MKKQSLFCIVLALIFVLCSINVFAFTGNNIKVNITLGVGESRVLSNYTKNNSTQISWSIRDNSIAYISNNMICGKKPGTTVITGTSGEFIYTFNIKVLENFTDTNTIDTPKATNTAVTKSDGSTISYTDIYLKVGIKDVVNIADLLPAKYDKYSWRVNSKKYITYSKGVIKGVNEGIVTLTAAGNTSTNKNSIFRFYITVDNDVIAKNVQFVKEKTINLSGYIGDAENFKYSVVAGQGSSVTVTEKGLLTTSTAKGCCIVIAESLIGEKNYTFIVKTL